MAIALLTGGASLTRDWNGWTCSQYDHVIAVNRAALLFPHDYNVYCDEAMMREASKWPTLTTEVVVTNNPPRPMEPHMLHYKLPLYGESHAKLESAGVKTLWDHPCSHTFPCALAFAGMLAELTGDPLDIYGLDCQGVGVGPGCHEYNWSRWGMELPWVAFAMPKAIRHIHGDIRKDWKEWILNPNEHLQS